MIKQVSYGNYNDIVRESKKLCSEFGYACLVDAGSEGSEVGKMAYEMHVYLHNIMSGGSYRVYESSILTALCTELLKHNKICIIMSEVPSIELQKLIGVLSRRDITMILLNTV